MKREIEKQLSLAIARLVPNIIQGVHLGFLAGRDITHTQFFVLIAIHSKKSCTMRALAENMNVSMPTMSGIVGRLVKAHLLKRIENPSDRRQVLVELTADGQRLIEQFQGAVGRRWEEVLKHLEEKEMMAFHHVVEKITSTLKEKEPA